METTSDRIEAKPDQMMARDVESLSKVSAQKSETLTLGTHNPGSPIRVVGWKHASITMMKTQLGIGVLSIPGAFQFVGLIPGLIILTASTAIMTWSNYQIGRFKQKHPKCYGLEDAAYILFGRVGQEVFMSVFLLYWIFVTGSAYVTLSACLNALSEHGACTAAFVAVSAAGGFLLCSVKDLRKVSRFAIPATICIVISVLILTIAVAVQDRPAAAPQTGPWTPDWMLVGSPTFAETMSSISTLIFAFSGTPAFFQIEAEMKIPQHYNKAMFACQGTVYIIYVVVGIVVYHSCGTFVTSPALGSAGPLLKKICYGIALPGLCVTTMIVAHIPAKAVYMRVVRSRERWQRHVSITEWRAWAFWLACTGCVSLAGYVVASAVPGFESLVSLIGALFGTFISIVPYGCMWLYDNLPMERDASDADGGAKNLSIRQRWRGRAPRLKERDVRWNAMACGAVLVVVGGLFCMVGGTYGSGVAMKKALEETNTGPWTCADNA